MTAAEIGLVLCFAGIAACIWMLLVNQMTFDDRGYILDALHDMDGCSDWRQRYKDYEQVAYVEHLWARFLLKDPMKLYSTDLQDLMRGSK